MGNSGSNSLKPAPSVVLPKGQYRLNTHTPSRTINVWKEPSDEIDIPLCKSFPEEGSVKLKLNSPSTPYEGIFSFTIYYRGDIEEFRKSNYYIGLYLYAEIIHTNPFFNNVGMILYTDRATYSVLFPLFTPYEKVIFGITTWPAFAIGSRIEDSILRCMRFQALEAFPESWICVRDADTIFPNEIHLFEEAYSKGYKGSETPGGPPIEDYKKFLVDKIGEWEQLFIINWLGDKQNPIYLGVDPTYRTGWHTDMGVKWPLKNVRNEAVEPKVRVKPEMLGRFKNYEKDTGTKLFFRAPFGIWAGFTNFSNGRPDDLWKLCYDYLTRRYLLRMPKPIISNEKITLAGSAMVIGKDERILLFAIIPKYVSICYFYWINYTHNLKEFKLDLNRSLEYPSFSSIGIPVKTLAYFGTLEYFYKKEKYANRGPTETTIQTKMLQPAYVSGVQTNLKLTNGLLEDLTYRFKSIEKYLPSELKNNVLRDSPVGDIFKVIFTNFAKDYNKWISELMLMPDIDSKLQEIKIKRRQNGYVNDYNSYNNSDFFQQPSRINPSRIVGGRKYTHKLKHKKRRTTRK